MSTIYQRNGKGNYYYCGADKRPRTMKTANLLEAQMLQNKWDRESFRSERGLINQDKEWGDYRQEYEHVYEAEHAPESMVKLKIVLDGFERLSGITDTTKIISITTDKVELWRAARLREGLSRRSVDAEQKYLAPVLRKAHKKGFLERDPFEGIKRLRFSVAEPLALSVPESSRFLDEAHYRYPNYALCVKFFQETGMRVGEVIHQRIEDIDFFRGVINVLPHGRECRCHQCGTSGKGWLGKAGVPRKIPMSASLQAELLALFQTKKDGCIFPYARNTLVGVFNRLFKRINVAGKTATKIFRHSLATDMEKAGVRRSVIRVILGHAKQTTTDGYIHATDDDLKDGIRTVVAWRESQRPGKTKKPVGLNIVEEAAG